MSAQTNVNQTNQATTSAIGDNVRIRRVENGYIVDARHEYSSIFFYSSSLHVFETFAGLMAFLKKEFPIVARD